VHVSLSGFGAGHGGFPLRYPYTDQVGPDAPVKARESGDDTVHYSTLASFFDANADGVSPAEQVDIVRTLHGGATYRGGGGAAAEWSLELAR
jgi:hypothetical protein